MMHTVYTRLKNVLRPYRHRTSRILFKALNRRGFSDKAIPELPPEILPVLARATAQLLTPVESGSKVPAVADLNLELENLLRNQKLPLLIPGTCNVCGDKQGFPLRSYNFREGLSCRNCRSSNRKRQIAAILMQEAGIPAGAVLKHCTDRLPGPAWVMETGAFAELMAGDRGFKTEYFGPDLASGQIKSGIRHEDAMAPSFAERSLELVISCDVFEHIPDPYRAHAAIFNCLKPGGSHVFTVPFLDNASKDDVCATIEAGQIRYLTEPKYHFDHLRPEGILVFTLFSPQMLSRLEEIGYQVSSYRVRDPQHGILGGNGLVFVARRSIS